MYFPEATMKWAPGMRFNPGSWSDILQHDEKITSSPLHGLGFSACTGIHLILGLPKSRAKAICGAARIIFL
jgi:hypothetical protein